MKFLLGKKIGMSQVFDSAGNVTPVTLVEAGPLTVLQRKTKEKDGYESLQFGFGTRKAKNIKKPQKGHFKEMGSFSVVREFRIEGLDAVPEVGAKVDVSVFKEGDAVKVAGITKAKGFQGVVKRHGFHGASATHGTKHAHREPGSIGATWPQRVIKGRRMAGRMGADRVTIEGLRVVKIDQTHNLLAINGAIPGRNGGLLEIISE
ncbi:MAG: 50S ribosomal protein L3 [Patescibacteria group bacterium]